MLKTIDHTEDYEITAQCLVDDYIHDHLTMDASRPNYKIKTVWACKILQNRKYLMISDLPDQKYYEVTYNGDKHEWYIDAYDKIENVCVKEE